MKNFLLIAAIAAIFALSYADIISESLEAHNKYRTPLGIPALTWSSSLAKSAQTWANYIAKNRKTSHSKNRVNVGENLAYGSAKSNTIAKLVDRWADEKEDFVEGKNFPECTTDDVSDVWHYTQMVWEKTTEVGCGLGSYSGRIYLVCQYSPAGNRNGEPVYTVKPIETDEPEQPEEPVVTEPVDPVVTLPVEPVVTLPVEQPTEPVVTPPTPVPVTPEPADDFVSQSLAAHNKYRNPYGVPSLTWSTTLAQSAQTWAAHLAESGQFSHSTNRNRVGENIAWAKNRDTAGFVDMWGEEKQYFIPGKNYPDCSSTGSSGDVGHYTQIMWRDTTQVGCGMADNNGKKYFVCQYGPGGNIRGKPVY